MLIKKNVISLFLLIFLAIALFACDKKAKIDYPAPDFTLPSIDDTEHTLSSFKGKVVFVNFWATWCPPCREEIPSMIRLYNQLKDKDIQIIAISVDQDDEAVKNFVKENGIPFLVLRDKEKKAYNLYKATGVPETHLITKKGIVKNSQIGAFDWTNPGVINTVNTLLAEE